MCQTMVAMELLELAASASSASASWLIALWYYPIRHSLGGALLKAWRNSEAERVYREDLKRFPENGWVLYGLAQALRARGKTAEASAVDARFRRAWAAADVTLLASRF